MTALDNRDPSLRPGQHAWKRHPFEPGEVCARCGLRRSVKTETAACTVPVVPGRVLADYDPMRNA